MLQFLREHPEIRGLNLFCDKEYWGRTREKAKLEYVDDGGKVIPIES
jgi:hypothetical protein